MGHGVASADRGWRRVVAAFPGKIFFFVLLSMGRIVATGIQHKREKKEREVMSLTSKETCMAKDEDMGLMV